MNIYGYEGRKDDLVHRKVLEIIRKSSINDSIKTAILNNEWVLTLQEDMHIINYPKSVNDYLEFRWKFRNSYISPDYDHISKFPLYVVVEPSSVCNLKCKMCFQQDNELRKHVGNMSLALFKKIVDECVVGKVGAITIAGRGEPLINPCICEMIEYTNNKFFEVKLNTNGLLLTEKICHSLLKANISMIVFSAEGCNQEEYEFTRCGGKLDILIRNIELFNEIKKLYPDVQVQTRVSGVLFDKNVDKERYYSFWGRYVDEVVLTLCEARSDTYNNDIVCIDNPCYRMWERLYIWYDGTCSPCDVDYLQKLDFDCSVVNNSIEEIWNCEKINIYRELHKSGNRKKCIPCDRCDVR